VSSNLIPWWRTDLGDAEISGVAEAIRGRHINRGPLCKELERRLAEMLGVPYVVVTTSGSVALLMSLLACGVEPGDEVIMPAGAFIAGAHAALLIGAKVRLVDVCADRPLIDTNLIEAAITDRTKVMLPVHLNGTACDMAAIKDVAGRHGVKVVEDAAQAFTSRGPDGTLGTLADAGAFSMGITKLITTGEGGFVATADEEMDAKLRKLRNHGALVLADNVFDEFGLNFRFNDMLAAVALAQLDKVSEKIEALKRIRAFYCERLAGLAYIRLIDVRVDQGELPLWTEAVCSERDKVVALLRDRGIQAKPSHPCLADSPHLDAAGDFPNAAHFAEHGLVLPSGPDQPQSDLERVVEALHDVGRNIHTALEPK